MEQVVTISSTDIVELNKVWEILLSEGALLSTISWNIETREFEFTSNKWFEG